MTVIRMESKLQDASERKSKIPRTGDVEDDSKNPQVESNHQYLSYQLPPLLHVVSLLRAQGALDRAHGVGMV